MNFIYSILCGVLGVLLAEAYKKRGDRLFLMKTLSKIGVKYKRCACRTGLEHVQGESFGTFAPEFYSYRCSKCNGNLFVLKKEKK